MLTRIAPILRRRELKDDPFSVVRRPDANSIALTYIRGDESSSALLDVIVELLVCPTNALVARYQRVGSGMAGDDVAPHLPDRLSSKWKLGCPAGVRM